MRDSHRRQLEQRVGNLGGNRPERSQASVTHSLLSWSLRGLCHEASSSCSRRTSRYRGIPAIDPFAMPTSQILRHLYSLDTSSPDFSRYLYHLIQSDGEDHYLLDLQGSDLIRLVDFLDKVRVPPSASLQLTEQASQALTIIPTADDVSRLCLHKLQAICSHHGILPSSHIISGGLTKLGDYPVASGGFAEVWEGMYKKTKVCIKCPRINTRDRQDIEKVNDLHGTPIPRLLNGTCWHIGVL